MECKCLPILDRKRRYLQKILMEMLVLCNMLIADVLLQKVKVVGFIKDELSRENNDKVFTFRSKSYSYLTYGKQWHKIKRHKKA